MLLCKKVRYDVLVKMFWKVSLMLVVLRVEVLIKERWFLVVKKEREKKVYVSLCLVYFRYLYYFWEVL